MKLLQGDHSILPSYLGVLNDLRKTFQARPFERPFVFLLHKPYSQSSTIRATADQEIQFYDRLLKKVRERWPDLQIVFKVHPKSSAFLVKRLKELCEWPSDFERLPGELFAQDPNAKIVLGGISTTSIYSSVLFGKEAYYVSPDFVEDTPKVQSEKEAAKRFNVNYFPVD